ncbi:hypothetical protein IAD21_02012 [Abditibacteriota bacterium]|nr:hypothetical protein IAD21_02012 [Abditibacteriota bacterium]
MTRKEAKAYETRMRRVWAPLQHAHSSFVGYVGNKRWEFVGTTREFALYIDVGASSSTPTFEMRGPGHYTQAAGLRYDEEINDRCTCDAQEAFTNQWLPYFRRGLWLSGCPIEASAHEKMEWIEGFTREELETWDLKI